MKFQDLYRIDHYQDGQWIPQAIFKKYRKAARAYHEYKNTFVDSTQIRMIRFNPFDILRD